MTQKFKAIDLFAGIGGIRLGFMQAFQNDIEFIFANEINKFNCQTYEANFGIDPYGDITKIDPKEIPDFDILLAGFPCQSFSLAGKKKGFYDPRGSLFFYIAKILEEKKPYAFFLENVKNLIYHDKGKTFNIIRYILEVKLKYTIYYKILNAKNFNLPQNRNRIYIVGFKDRIDFDFPKPICNCIKIKDILEKNVDESYYISQKYLLWLKRHKNRHAKKGNRFGYEILSEEGFANTLVCGGMGKDRNLIKDKLPKNVWKKEGDNLSLRNNEGLRRLTINEWSKLQGFPNNFKFPVSKTQAYRQIANSVPVPVIKEIAKKMRESLLNKKFKHTNNFFYLNEDQFNAIILLEKMYYLKQFNKNKRKSIDSLRKFTKQISLLINDFQKFKDFLIKYGIIKIKGNYIRFNEEIYKESKIKSFEDFRNYIYDYFFKYKKNKLNQSSLNDFLI